MRSAIMGGFWALVIGGLGLTALSLQSPLQTQAVPEAVAEAPEPVAPAPVVVEEPIAEPEVATETVPEVAPEADAPVVAEADVVTQEAEPDPAPETEIAQDPQVAPVAVAEPETPVTPDVSSDFMAVLAQDAAESVAGPVVDEVPELPLPSLNEVLGVVPEPAPQPQPPVIVTQDAPIVADEAGQTAPQETIIEVLPAPVPAPQRANVAPTPQPQPAPAPAAVATAPAQVVIEPLAEGTAIQNGTFVFDDADNAGEFDEGDNPDGFNAGDNLDGFDDGDNADGFDIADDSAGVVVPEAAATEPAPQETAVAPVDDVAGEDVAAEDPFPADAPAILRYAAAFENPDQLPVIGVVLIDDGSQLNGPAQLLESGLVTTVAISALMDSANLFAEAYREAGAEVAMQVPLPDGATPVDVEVAYAAAFETLPEAAMLFSDGAGVLRNSRTASAQVMQILAADGRGFVTQQRGLGSLVRAAERAEVPVATIERDIDGAGEDVRAIGRALDQAAFRARQSGGSVVLARLTPQTLTVLRSWADEAAREGLLVGPVSALLIEPQDPAPEEGAAADDADADPESAENE